MTIEEQLKELSKKIDDYQLENSKKSTKERYENLSYILWGLALATLSLAVTQISVGSTIVSAFATAIFVFLGWFEWSRSRK